MITYEELQVCIKKAEMARACSSSLEVIKKIKTIEELLSHPKVAFWACWYTDEVIKGPWLEAENIIKNDPESSYFYAYYVLKTRWRAGEDAIKRMASTAYPYATNVIKGRWEPGEEAIKKHSTYSYLYAKYVIKGSWPEAEEMIKQNTLCWTYYLEFLAQLKGYKK